MTREDVDAAAHVVNRAFDFFSQFLRGTGVGRAVTSEVRAMLRQFYVHAERRQRIPPNRAENRLPKVRIGLT